MDEYEMRAFWGNEWSEVVKGNPEFSGFEYESHLEILTNGTK